VYLADSFLPIPFHLFLAQGSYLSAVRRSLKGLLSCVFSATSFGAKEFRNHFRRQSTLSLSLSFFRLIHTYYAKCLVHVDEYDTLRSTSRIKTSVYKRRIYRDCTRVHMCWGVTFTRNQTLVSVLINSLILININAAKRFTTLCMPMTPTVKFQSTPRRRRLRGKRVMYFIRYSDYYN